MERLEAAKDVENDLFLRCLCAARDPDQVIRAHLEELAEFLCLRIVPRRGHAVILHRSCHMNFLRRDTER